MLVKELQRRKDASLECMTPWYNSFGKNGHNHDKLGNGVFTLFYVSLFDNVPLKRRLWAVGAQISFEMLGPCADLVWVRRVLEMIERRGGCLHSSYALISSHMDPCQT